jgi:putative hydrolase of the HAD superfamily
VTIRAVFFDAVGTLMQPHPPAPEVYLTVARLYGSRLSLAEVTSRFGRAFARQEVVDREEGWRTSEVRERLRWETIVGEVLEDVHDVRDCFADLYDHFAKPQAWRLLDHAEAALTHLAGRGQVLGVASNFDARLRGILAELPIGSSIQHILISSEVGWRKPAEEFFHQIPAMTGFAPGEILFVGDDLDNDYHGARAAGCDAILLDPQSRHHDVRTIRSLDDLKMTRP